MTMCKQLTSALLFFFLVVSIGCSPKQTNTDPRTEGTFILYRLDGDRYPGDPVPEGAVLLHGWQILKECPITSLETREQLFKAFDRGIDEYNSEYQIDCFNPRHAIRVESMGVTVDYLICFQCSNYYIYEGDKHVSGGNTTSSPKSTFDRILSSCN